VTRLFIVVEGQTEESFVRNVLAEALWASGVHPTPILLGRQGGRPSYARVKRDVLVLLKQDHGAHCSTMIDFYGLGPGFPGQPFPDRPSSSNLSKVRQVERAVKKDICSLLPDLRPDLRFIPHLQLHEYEALLFSDPTAFANGINHPNLARQFQRIRDEFASPEDINNNPETAPSKRVLSVCPSYRKVIEGTQAALAVGVLSMREHCQHFREWVEALEALSDA
jgi:hypothetical protein